MDPGQIYNVVRLFLDGIKTVGERDASTEEKTEGSPVNSTETRKNPAAKIDLPERREDFWNLVCGGEVFDKPHTLYQAVANGDSQITAVTVTNRHSVMVSVRAEAEGVEKSLDFKLEVHRPASNGMEDDLIEVEYLKAIVKIAQDKTPYLGNVLEGIWSQHLAYDDELERMTRI